MTEAALPLALGAGASALGNYLGAQAASGAAKQAAALQQQRFNQAVTYEKPFIAGGQNALNSYNDAIGVSGRQAQQAYYQGFQNDPGFQASVDYGLGQVEASNAARGLTLSGNNLADISGYAQRALLGEYHTRLDDLFREGQLGAGSANALTAAATSSAANQGSFGLIGGQYQGAGLANAGANIYGAAKDFSKYYYGAN
jgi:hypothetical protein